MLPMSSCKIGPTAARGANSSTDKAAGKACSRGIRRGACTFGIFVAWAGPAKRAVESAGLEEGAGAMAKWKAFPGDGRAFHHDRAALKVAWKGLHRADTERWPADGAVQEAWALFHAGAFRAAVDAGLKAGGAGVTCANKAQTIYATYLEADEKRRRALLLEVVERARAQQAEQPKNANAHYWVGHALGRYSQDISIGRALAEGLGGRVKTALLATLELAPTHADALAALGAFHAEVIGKVGRLLAWTQGGDARVGVESFEQALALVPNSPTVLLECARGLPMIEGGQRQAQAAQLRAAAAAVVPQDAAEWLGVERARAERSA